MKAWKDERPKHGIVFLYKCTLICTCGEQLSLSEADEALSQSRRNDILLDAHAVHKARAERRK